MTDQQHTPDRFGLDRLESQVDLLIETKNRFQLENTRLTALNAELVEALCGARGYIKGDDGGCRVGQMLGWIEATLAKAKQPE